MPTYLRPGVFVEETLTTLSDPALDTTDAVAAFVGTSTKGGPLGPTLINSWSQYMSLFGDVRGTTDELGYSVYSFFNNGGSQCYVARAVNENAVSASLSLNDTAATPAETLTVEATSPGTWASDATSTSRVFITVATSVTTGRFDLTVEVGTGSTLLAREQFIDLSLDPADTRYALTVLNSPTVGSKYVNLIKEGTWADATNNPAAVTKVPLTGGSDGTGTPDLFGATQRLDNVDALLTVNLPGVSDGPVLTNVIGWAEATQDRFVVIDAPKPAPGADPADLTTAATALVGTLPKSSYAAVYTPWVYGVDPSSSVSGALRLMAPGGGVIGQYARNDVSRSVAKAPAGTETAMRIIQVAARFTNTQLDTLNQANVNVIRSLPGIGFCIMGARTLNTRTNDRYINVRRTLMSLKRGLVEITRFAVFEPNDETLWDTIQAVCSQYLQTQFQLGVLRGDAPDTAFYVKCDSEINDAQAVDAGVVRVEVGVALSSPAEFIVIKIGQFDGGTTVDEIETV